MTEMTTTSKASGVTRLDRRKARTRQALIDAAVKLIAEGRGERASIQEITEAADIGENGADSPCCSALHLAVRRETVSLRIGWICLLVVGAGILIFGLVAVLAPTSDDRLLMRADGLASTGLGLFGVLMAAFPFRRRERWAWYAFWFYPVFWSVHLIDRLPPGTDHIHQVVFLVLSLAALLVTIGQFFPGRDTRPTPSPPAEAADRQP